MSTLLKQLLLPPASLILISFVGLIVARKRWDIGWWIAAISLFLFYLMATPIGAGALSRVLETSPPLALGALPVSQAQAIVILGSDGDYAAELGGDTVGALTLARLRYGARLQRRTGLPILVSGGPPGENEISLAEHMSQALATDYGISDSWMETHSRDTWENAVDSAVILRAKNVDRIYLVTHARDMPRALRAFRLAGLTVIPAPIAFEAENREGLHTISPSAKSLLASYYALYEIVGGIEYKVLHPDTDPAGAK